MTVTIETTGTKVQLSSPYHPDLPAKARKLGGKFDRSTSQWQFDVRDEQRVRALAREVYGTDGATEDAVTIRIRMADYSHHLYGQRGPEQLWVFGRQIVTRRGRDIRVELGPGVVVIEGGFGSSGGSVKNPCINADDGTVLEIRDIPAGHPDLTEYAKTIEGIEESALTADVDALLAERERLLARVAEIDAQLPEPEGVEADTRQAASALGVSVRNVQRWAQAGKVEACKDGAGRWVITITT